MDKCWTPVPQWHVLCRSADELMPMWMKDITCGKTSYTNCTIELLGPLRQNILFYMAGWAARQVLKVLWCDECRATLVAVEPYQAFLSHLTMVKQKGGIMYASRSTYRVILLADRALEHELIKRNGQPPQDKQFLAQLLLVIFQTCAVDRHVFSELADHDGSSLSLTNMCLASLSCWPASTWKLDLATWEMSIQHPGLEPP